MLKYVNTGIVFQEIPDEVALAINISGCPCRCPGCHSRYLWGDAGEPLTAAAIDNMVKGLGDDITCISFMGGDADPSAVDMLACYIRHAYPRYKVAWWSGRSRLARAIHTENFQYIKLGPYLAHLGPLNSRSTNQRMYRVEKGRLRDVTPWFWRFLPPSQE